MLVFGLGLYQCFSPRMWINGTLEEMDIMLGRPLASCSGQHWLIFTTGHVE